MVLPPGFEPRSSASEADILSIELRELSLIHNRFYSDEQEVSAVHILSFVKKIR